MAIFHSFLYVYQRVKEFPSSMVSYLRTVLLRNHEYVGLCRLITLAMEKHQLFIETTTFLSFHRNTIEISYVYLIHLHN